MGEPDQIAEIRARVEQATLGPWNAFDNYVKIGDSDMVQFDTGNPIVGDSSHDTHFIAHAREDIPYLLARVTALEQALRDIIGAVPHSWLDELLSGPSANRVPLDGPAVERLLSRVKARQQQILDAALSVSAPAPGGE